MKKNKKSLSVEEVKEVCDAVRKVLKLIPARKKEMRSATKERSEIGVQRPGLKWKRVKLPDSEIQGANNEWLDKREQSCRQLPMEIDEIFSHRNLFEYLNSTYDSDRIESRKVGILDPGYPVRQQIRRKNIDFETPDYWLDVKWRAIRFILDLGKLCGPEARQSNPALIAALRSSPWKTKSLFFKALRIEPSLLQTKVGVDLLCRIPLGHPEGVKALKEALLLRSPSTKSKRPSESDVIKLSLSIVYMAEPRARLMEVKDLSKIFFDTGYFKNLKTKTFSNKVLELD